MPTPILLTGFEHGVAPPSASGALGLYDLTVTDSITIVTSPVNSGVYALQIAQTASTRNAAWNFAAQDRIIWRFYVRFPTSLPAATVQIAHIIVTAGKALQVRFNQATGKLNLIWGGTTDSQDSVASVSADTWYRIDLDININAATRTADWQMAVGDAAGTAQTQSASTETASTTTGIRLGGSGSQTMTAVYDDLYLSVTAADYPIGAGSTELLTPTGDGTHNAGVNVLEDQAGVDIGVVTAFDLVDDVPLSGTADYIRQVASGSGNYAEVTFSNTTNTNITGVMGEVNRASASSGFAANGAMVVIRDDATEVGVLGTSAAPASFTNTAPGYVRAVITAPGGGWTQAEVNALKGRIGYSTDVSPNPRFHAFALEVAYAPAVTALDPREVRTYAEGSLRWAQASGTGGWVTASGAPTALVGFVLPGAAYRSARTLAAVLERDVPHHHKLLSNDPIELQFAYRQAVTANRPNPATASGATVPKVHFEIKTLVQESPTFTAHYFQFEQCAKIAEGWTETPAGNVWTETWRALSMTGPTGSGYLS